MPLEEIRQLYHSTKMGFLSLTKFAARSKFSFRKLRKALNFMQSKIDEGINW